MKHYSIAGTVRTTGTKADIREVRNAGRVPCNFYGNGVENVAFSVDEKDFLALVSQPASFIIDLDIDGKVSTAVLREVQYHPVTDRPLHIDFVAVTEDKPITIDVPVRIFGNSEGVRQGGKLTVNVRKLRVSALMADLPDELPVDITTLKLGKRINAGDLHYDKVNIVTPKTAIVCAVKATRNAVAAAAEAE
ncbi:MAG: 50S ribosomal protein L25 [Bacteroidales bacterium]|jgi:large subunit ribosomal protein L25|nr:50S ribosomal protein L25 [Bacteroidales bacterium]MBR5671217.1 50S ribosomal protein L25 [Bacteroidales bacterium]